MIKRLIFSAILATIMLGCLLIFETSYNVTVDNEVDVSQFTDSDENFIAMRRANAPQNAVTFIDWSVFFLGSVSDLGCSPQEGV